MGSKVDLLGAWQGLWGRIASGDASAFFTFLTWVGVALVVWAIVKWGWSRRRGGAQAGLLGYPLFVGAALAAPNAVIPAVLWLADILINAFITVLG